MITSKLFYSKQRCAASIGDRYNQLVIYSPIFYIPIDGNIRKAGAVCVCDCGNYIYARINSLKTGGVKSCGCRKLKDQKYNTRIYKIWLSTRSRCNRRNDKKSHLWANKGIKLCDEWQNFDNFKRWAYSNGFKDEIVTIENKMDCLSLDRVDPNKDYCPDNCRWITLRQNSKNVLEVRKEKLETLLWRQMCLHCQIGNDYY